MGRVVIASISEAPLAIFPALQGVSARGEVETRRVIAGDDRPISLWEHTLRPGAELRWNAPPIGQVLYVRDGAIEVDGLSLQEGAAVVVEHGARLTVCAGTQGARLLHFHRPAGHAERPARAGGHAHVVGPEGLYRVGFENASGVGQTLFADADCPTCTLWLHRTDFAVPDYAAPPHYHTEDEIIVVVKGQMKFGTRLCSPGTALAIDANTTYSFAVGSEGLSFINFRTAAPSIVLVNRDGNSPVLSERALMKRAAAGTAA